VATIVYEHGASTAKYVMSCLSAELSNGAVRSMLVRLVNKGVLRRKWGSRGRGQEFLYMPAVTPEDVQRNSLQILTDRYFDGSLLTVAHAVLALLEEERVAFANASSASASRGQEIARVDLAA
jgi:predicted transcriptional regulator